MAEEMRRTAARPVHPGAAVRHSRRRNTVNLYTTIAAAITAALGSLLSVNVLFNLSPTGLTVNGVTLYSPQQIQQIGGLVPGQNLVRLNTEYIERRLTENLVYIDKVSVLKDYPDGLIINVTEAKPAVQIEYEGGYCTMSKSGRILEAGETERDPLLPLVTGYELTGYETPSEKAARLEAEAENIKTAPKKPDVKPGTRAISEDDQKTAILSELLAKLEALEFGKIAKIDIKDRTDIKLIYDGRIQIELGSSVEMDIKLTQIKAVIDTELPESYEGRLRYNGIDRGISAIPKKTDLPVAVKKPGTAAGTAADGAADSSAADSEADIRGFDPNAPIDPNNTWDNQTAGGWTDPNAGYDDYGGGWYDPNAGYDYGYDQGGGYYDYGYDQGYGYDQNYGYDYGYGGDGTW